MRPTLTQFERAESFVMGTLSPEEHNAFQTEMNANPDLQSLVDFQNEIVTAINRQGLRNEIQAVSQQMGAVASNGSVVPWKWILSSIVVVAVGFASYFAITTDSDNESSSTNGQKETGKAESNRIQMATENNTAQISVVSEVTDFPTKSTRFGNYQRGVETTVNRFLEETQGIKKVYEINNDELSQQKDTIKKTRVKNLQADIKPIAIPSRTIKIEEPIIQMPKFNIEPIEVSLLPETIYLDVVRERFKIQTIKLEIDLPKTGIYGVCNCDEESLAKVELTINEDYTFTYFNNEVPTKTVEIKGYWTLKNKTITLQPSSSDRTIPSTWTLDKTENCLKSKKGLEWTRLCHIKSCN